MAGLEKNPYSIDSDNLLSTNNETKALMAVAWELVELRHQMDNQNKSILRVADLLTSINTSLRQAK